VAAANPSSSDSAIMVHLTRVSVLIMPVDGRSVGVAFTKSMLRGG
jgi:hypothetical protein